MANGEIAVKVCVSGRVQGVSYRAWARDVARQHDVVGWMRNASDGSVQALVVGPEDEVADFVERLRQGPPAAEVRDIEIEPTDLPEPLPEDFKITR